MNDSECAISATEPRFRKFSHLFKWRNHRILLLTTIVVGIMSETFLFGVVVPILPSILHDPRFNTPETVVQSRVSLILALYSWACVAVSPFVGFTLDRFQSRRLPFLFGLVFLILSSALFFTASSFSIIISARCLQGASSAIIWTAGFDLCFRMTSPGNLGTMLGTVMSFVSFGAISAPPIGGLLFANFGLRGVGASTILILLLDFIMATFMGEGEEEYDQSTPSSDNICTARPRAQETTSLLPGEDEEIENLVLRWKLLKFAPILLCFRDPGFVAAVVLICFQAALMAAFDATVPLEAENLFQFDAFKSGMLFVPLATMRMVAGPLGGRCVDRFGPRIVSLIGFGTLALTLFMLRFVHSEPFVLNVTLYCVLLALCGVSLAMVGSPCWVESRSIVHSLHARYPDLFGAKGHSASLQGLNLMAFNLGFALGPILAGSLREKIGYGNMNASLALLAGCCATVSGLWFGGSP